MLVFAHLGLTLAGSRILDRPYGPAALALGAMLPDLVDKPLGWAVFGTPAMGRTVAHTLLFLIFLASLALMASHARWGQRDKIAALALGVAFHLTLDGMWATPATLLWPLLGGFPPAPSLGFLGYFQALTKGLADPWIAGPELLGLAYLLRSYRKDIASLEEGTCMHGRIPRP